MTTQALPTINDVALPTIAYDDAKTIDDVHQALRAARERSPIAQGPLTSASVPTWLVSKSAKRSWR